MCGHRDKGPKCFKCGIYGHKAPSCTKIDTPRNQVSCVSPFSHRLVKVTIDQLSCATLVDTGREVNLMRAAMHRKLGSLALRSTSRMFTGLGGQATKPIGKFKARVGMESGVYATEMFVVPDNSMQTDVIIGYELLKPRGSDA